MLNKVMIIGRLGKDPELKQTESKMFIGNFSLATSETIKGTEKTEWHNIVTFGKTAEHCSQYLGKGKLCYVEGKLQTRSWEAKDGTKKYTTEVVASVVKFLEKKDSYTNSQSSDSLDQSVPNFDAQKIADSVMFDDDDIPF